MPTGKPILIEAYHPDCKACKEFAADYEDLATYMREKKFPIEVRAINFSKASPATLKIEGYPTFRLYTAVGKFIEFDGDNLSKNDLKKWILKNELKLNDK